MEIINLIESEEMFQKVIFRWLKKMNEKNHRSFFNYASVSRWANLGIFKATIVSSLASESDLLPEISSLHAATSFMLFVTLLSKLSTTF
ncbi:hypothetical protein HHI36_009668 [Cryptolaemus montrouzieri]|uniref:Uncharacterized protein n=1 Tax=Cryptolaemus montrouzieri TaxID=559131 RepID=A0ABD2MGE7_9CUCU